LGKTNKKPQEKYNIYAYQFCFLLVIKKEITIGIWDSKFFPNTYFPIKLDILKFQNILDLFGKLLCSQKCIPMLSSKRENTRRPRETRFSYVNLMSSILEQVV